MTATGSAQGEPLRLSLESGALAELARTGKLLPLSLLGTSGDLRLEAKGKVAMEGSGQTRVQLSGRKLERLGTLIGVLPPAAEPPRDDRPMDQAIARTAASLLGPGQPLAKGRLTARVEAGTLRLSSSDVVTAGGTINDDVRVEANATPPVFAVNARARDLQYGPMLRALDPSTSLEGGPDFNVHLAAQAQPERLLRALSGTIDVATFPRGPRPRALILRGAGLINGLLRQLDPDSRSSIDCAVAGLDVERGVARSSGFFVDTTRVRIVGEVEIDLVTRAISGRIDTRSKVPQLLAVAPTMLLGGTADDPRVSAGPQNIVTVPLRGALTLGGRLGDWRAGSARVDDRQAACREAFRLLRQGGSQ